MDGIIHHLYNIHQCMKMLVKAWYESHIPLSKFRMGCRALPDVWRHVSDDARWREVEQELTVQLVRVDDLHPAVCAWTARPPAVTDTLAHFRVEGWLRVTVRAQVREQLVHA